MENQKQTQPEQKVHIRYIDDTGRLVLPFQFRKALGIDRNTELAITMEGSCLVIKVG